MFLEGIVNRVIEDPGVMITRLEKCGATGCRGFVSGGFMTIVALNRPLWHICQIFVWLPRKSKLCQRVCRRVGVVVAARFKRRLFERIKVVVGIVDAAERGVSAREQIVRQNFHLLIGKGPLIRDCFQQRLSSIGFTAESPRIVTVQLVVVYLLVASNSIVPGRLGAQDIQERMTIGICLQNAVVRREKWEEGI